MASRRTFAERIAAGLTYVGETTVFSSEDWLGMLADFPATAGVVGTDVFPMTTADVPYTATAADILAYIQPLVGDVRGPASATDHAIARFDLTTGKLIQNSLVTVSDTGQVAIAAGAADDAFIVTSTFNGYQGKFRYDATHYLGIGVTSTGNTTIRAVGTSGSAPLGFFAGTNSALNFTGTGINYFAGASPVTFQSTSGSSTAQIQYDVANYLNILVSSAGAVTFNAVGTGGAFTFSDLVAITAQNPATDVGLALTATDTGVNGNLFGFTASVTKSAASGTAASVIGFSGTATASGAAETVTDLIGVSASVARTNGTVTNGRGLRISAISSAMTNAYGAYIEAVTGGTSLNYAIYTNAGLVRLGGALTVASGGAAITGNSSITGLLTVTDSGNRSASVINGVTLSYASGNLTGAVSSNIAYDNNDSRYEYTAAETGVLLLLGDSGRATLYIAGAGSVGDAFTGNIGWQVNSSGLVGIGVAATTTSYLTLPASTTSASTVRVPHGAAPTTPVNGDLWSVSGASLFHRNNGTTQYASWTRQAAIADATGGSVQDSEARAALNDLLAKLRTINILAT